MTNRKNYNSILFLTVYLGLVLVGATPQVLAHAATNSFFDLRNEIEFKDDLDNKPDDIFEEIKRLESDKEFAEFAGFLAESLRESDDIRNGLADVKISQKDFLGKLKAQVNLKFKSLSSGFVQEKQITNFQDFRKTNFLKKLRYENSSPISSDNYTKVVTNLPRASIDSLLKQ